MKTKTLLLSALIILTSLSFRGSARLEDGVLTNPLSNSSILKTVKNFLETEDESSILVNLVDIQNKGYSSGSAKDSIWSGDYWPLRNGGIAGTYKGGLKTRLLSFLDGNRAERKFNKKWSNTSLLSLSEDEVSELSPSEKLDVLLSDYNLTLSKNVWTMIHERKENVATKIETWEGVCHGWATAAIQAPRPTKTVYVRSRDGRYVIPFYPNDIKALSSWLWGNSLIQENIKFEGYRCNNEDRTFDPVTGLSNDPKCNGVEPSVFHITLANLMGVKKESFVINKNTDTKIWNQPIHSYSYKTFNILTGREGHFNDSVVNINDIQNDIYAAKRDKETRFVVGINMVLKYVRETIPKVEETDSEKNDKIKKLYYTYDLELDAKGNIVGGQWRNFKTDDEAIENSEEVEAGNEQPSFPGFPGFMWKISKNFNAAFSVGDQGEIWDVGQPIPASFLQDSMTSAQFKYKFFKFDANGTIVKDSNGNPVVIGQESRAQPLSNIVHGLLRASKDPNDRRNLE